MADTNRQYELATEEQCSDMPNNNGDTDNRILRDSRSETATSATPGAGGKTSVDKRPGTEDLEEAAQQNDYDLLVGSLRKVGDKPIHIAAEHYLVDAYRVWSTAHPKRRPSKKTYEQRLEIFQKTAKLVREWNAEHDSTKQTSLHLRSDELDFSLWNNSNCVNPQRDVSPDTPVHNADVMSKQAEVPLPKLSEEHVSQVNMVAGRARNIGSSNNKEIDTCCPGKEDTDSEDTTPGDLRPAKTMSAIYSAAVEEAVMEARREKEQNPQTLLRNAEQIVGNKKLHDAAKDNLLAAYRVWCHGNPKRFRDRRRLEEKLKIFVQNAHDLREQEAKYPNRLTKVGLNLIADEILYDELMAHNCRDQKPYKGDLPFSRPAPESDDGALIKHGPSRILQA